MLKMQEGLKMIRRIVIKWDTISTNLCAGVVTLDEWEDKSRLTSAPTRTTTLSCSIEKGSSSLKNFSKEIITEEINKEIRIMMDCFFAGVRGEDSVFSWPNLFVGE
jgi:hypothetical protein